MEKRLIGRGLVAGAVGAVLAFAFARLCAEPVIGRAIAFEDGRIDALGARGLHEHGAELFTRGVQSTAGLGFGVLIFGLAMGALFGVLFCVVSARATNVGPQPLSLLLAAAAFGAVYLVPFVKYPPNPPAVGQADTIQARTGWYLMMVVTSVALAVVAAWLARGLTARFGVWSGRLLAAGTYVAAVAAVAVPLPSVDETPPGFPADVLYEFRLLSLATQLVLWATIGVVFATLAARLLGERVGSAPEPSHAT
ncbi:cobalt transporter [Mycobacterium sp. E2699]|uniref:CbtA family protein n=1 Tax=Mycobacterium sp. E2699 TaxID=1834137 RepID=UPI00080129A6|nr:CbtA family protein [Mycobacterium sp. E2699]OBH08425.1 cobalt transporter [Mycobacterium sp. E2699]